MEVLNVKISKSRPKTSNLENGYLGAPYFYYVILYRVTHNAQTLIN